MSDPAAAAGDPTVARPSPSEAPEQPPPSIGELKGLLGAAVSIADDHRLRRRLNGTRRIRKPSKRTRALHDIAQQIDRARREQSRRRAELPTPGRPDDLPITARADEVVQAIRDSQVVVVAGETGSGKSTQLPKLCLEAGLGVRGMIGHTQPRRIAARAVAERVAEELDTKVGQAVGYTVRFTDQVGPKTLIKVMTDGILLNELQRDRDLRAYEVLIIDEAHERGLNIDFILGYVKQLLPRRPDLKVIITSATIDTERFAGHFTDADGQPAPIIEVSGRTYPVDVRYRPLDEGWPTDDEDDDRGVSTDVERELVEGIADAVEELVSEGPGDILVFASGERDIRDAAEALRKRKLKGTEILPLYARLSADEQHRVFAPHRGRRIVIATNIAETSLTVPGIRYVIDPGLARISRYSRRTKVQRLPIEKVSQASANQRSGRCGRLGPGIAIRLYAEDDFASRQAFTEPEILRTNLASVILQMTALGLGDIGRFPFVDPPEQRQISDGVALLEELGAITPDPSQPGGRALTDIGRKLARLPTDPRLARMIVAAADEGCVEEVIVIAAALSIQDPREHPREARAQAEAAHDVHVEPGSDYLTLLNIWEHVQDLRRDLGSSAFRRQVKREFLHHLRIREWMDVVRQLRRVAKDLGLPMSREPQDPMAVHRAMLAGLLSNVGLREGNSREYLGTRGTKFVIGRRSALADDPPGWIVAAELVETARTFAGMAGSIRPQWIEVLAGDLVTRTHAEAFWDDDRAQAVTLEKVSFRGIPLAEGRRVPLSPIDPAQARRLFIEHALVAGEWSGSHRFQADNAARVREVHKLEARLRRPGLMAPEDVVVDHYQLMVPAEVVDGRSFDRWWTAASRDDPHLLDVSVEQLLEGGQDQLSALADFPDTWTSVGGDEVARRSDLQLNYRYDPDDPEADGVTIDIPLTTLPRVHPGDFDWQVPGLREELVIALIRTLPKPLRRALVPAPDTARQVLSRVGPEHGPLLPVLARELTRIGGVDVTVDSWAGASIPDHLRMRYRVMGEDGALASGRDLGALKKGVEAHLRRAVRDATPVPHHTGLTGFSIAPLPQEVRGGGAGVEVIAYPALVDEGQTVGVRAFSTRHEQVRAMRQGTRRLLRLNIPSPVRAASEGLDKAQKLALTFAPHADVSAVIEDCTACVIDAIVDDAGGPAWNADDFEQLRLQVRDRAPRLVVVTARATAGIVQSAQAVRERLRAALPPSADEAKRDVAQQLGRLVYPGFVAAAGGARLPHLPRYLQGMLVRLDAVGRNTSRDSDQMALVRDLEEELRQLRRLRGESLDADAADAIRWQLEELRIQCFAQQLGTAQKVSEARVRDALEGLRRARRP